MQDRNVEDVYPLSALQEGMLFDHEMEPDSTTHWNRIDCAIIGNLDSGLFQAAWQGLVDRHATFRTRFVRDKNGRAHQIVNLHADLVWHYEDLCALPKSESDELLRRRFLTDSPVNRLNRCPLMHLVLSKVGPEEHRLFWCYNHIILDGWSESILWTQLIDDYDSLVDGRIPDRLTVIPYSRYIAWLVHRERDASLSYWQHYLEGYRPTSLATGRRRKEVVQFMETYYSLTDELIERIRQYARQYNLTLNSIMQGSWALVLGSESGSADQVFGNVIADRSEELVGVDQIVGMLTAVVPVRYRTNSTRPVIDWLIEGQDDAIDMRRHTDLAINEIKQAIGMASEKTLVEVLYAFDNSGGRDSYPGAGQSIEVRDFQRTGRTGYPLTLLVIPDADIRVVFSFDTSLFTSDACQRMFDRLTVVLERLIEAPRVPVNELSFMTPSEEACFKQWNQTDHDLIGPQLLPACLFVRDRDWNKPAVICEGVTYSHIELQILSTQVANYLYVSGVRQGDLVGVLMERRGDLVPTLLGIMQLGAGYVPLDPLHPPDRLAYIVADTDIKVVCAHKSIAGILRDGPKILEIDTSFEEIQSQPVNPIHTISVDPASVAYVMHTSGSTGRPKGVVVSHGAVSNFLAAMAREPGITSTDTLLAVTTMSFDISVLELFLPIFTGATVHLVDREVAADGRRLLEILKRESISVMQATPATWRLLLAAGWDSSPELKVLCGGESLSQDLASELVRRAGQVWNVYGPTECTIWCTTARIKDASQPVTIGRPISNTRAHILDEDRKRQLPGVAGELFVGGRCLANCYLNQEKLTAERFVDDPFHPGELMYATGDLARWNTDGNLEHLGRLDTQVKIRGFRIELEEIETALAEVEHIEQAVVTSWQVNTDDNRLVAYLLPKPGLSVDIRELRKTLRARLPEYMVPPHFITIRNIPLTPSGKVDRQRLPNPSQMSIAAEVRVDPPETATEKVLAEIWQEVLGIAKVGKSDNFFEIGGHSLIANKAIYETEQRLGIRPDLRMQVMESLSTIADTIDARKAKEKTSSKILQWLRKSI